jgi:hypothetical protein
MYTSKRVHSHSPTGGDGSEWQGKTLFSKGPRKTGKGKRVFPQPSGLSLLCSHPAPPSAASEISFGSVMMRQLPLLLAHEYRMFMHICCNWTYGHPCWLIGLCTSFTKRCVVHKAHPILYCSSCGHVRPIELREWNVSLQSREMVIISFFEVKRDDNNVFRIPTHPPLDLFVSTAFLSSMFILFIYFILFFFRRL